MPATSGPSATPPPLLSAAPFGPAGAECALDAAFAASGASVTAVHETGGALTLPHAGQRADSGSRLAPQCWQTVLIRAGAHATTGLERSPEHSRRTRVATGETGQAPRGVLRPRRAPGAPRRRRGASASRRGMARGPAPRGPGEGRPRAARSSGFGSTTLGVTPRSVAFTPRNAFSASSRRLRSGSRTGVAGTASSPRFAAARSSTSSASSSSPCSRTTWPRTPGVRDSARRSAGGFVHQLLDGGVGEHPPHRHVRRLGPFEPQRVEPGPGGALEGLVRRGKRPWNLQPEGGHRGPRHGLVGQPLAVELDLLDDVRRRHRRAHQPAQLGQVPHVVRDVRPHLRGQRAKREVRLLVRLVQRHPQPLGDQIRQPHLRPAEQRRGAVGVEQPADAHPHLGEELEVPLRGVEDLGAERVPEERRHRATAPRPGRSVSSSQMSRSVPICRKHRRARNACIASASRSTAKSRSGSSARTTASVPEGSVTSCVGWSKEATSGSSFTAEVSRMPAAVDIESRLEKSLLGHVGRAIADFGLIAEGDRVMVGVSGGKDSHTLLRAAPHPPAALPGPVRPPRGDPRPGPPRVSRSAAGRPLRRAGHSLPAPP